MCADVQLEISSCLVLLCHSKVPQRQKERAEAWGGAGPMRRRVTSARTYQNEGLEHLFCRFLGTVEGCLAPPALHFVVQLCTA